MNKQLRQFLPKRTIKFYLFNQNASSNHYYLSSSNVAVLNIKIKHLPKVSTIAAQQSSIDDDLENSKHYTVIMNYVYQVRRGGKNI